MKALWRSHENPVADVAAVERAIEMNTLASSVRKVAGGLQIIS